MKAHNLAISLDGRQARTVKSCVDDTVQWAVTGGKAEPERAATRIGDRCYIGPNTTVAKGVTIDAGCVVGAGSVVLADLPAGSKAVGSPARMVGSADG